MSILTMLNPFRLLLPALIPSWRFFDTIAPSPRIEFTFVKTHQAASYNWHEFRPRPAHLRVRDMLGHLFLDPRWNETLFLVSCAERLADNYDEHGAREISVRIRAELERRGMNKDNLPYLRFRLVSVHREGARMRRRVTFTSQPYSCCASIAS
jgi:hypothetical protein